MRAAYNWQQEGWPTFTWDSDVILSLLGRVHQRLGMLVGKLSLLGFELQSSNTLEALSAELVNSWRIEGVELNDDMVRSSLARKLGLDIAGLPEASHYIDGVVQVMLHATQHATEPVTEQRLNAWHTALIPPVSAQVYAITLGRWREGDAPMQVVSGALGRERVHYEAPPSRQVPDEMARLLQWIEQKDDLDPLLRAAIAHLWFVSIHPYDDGNGRIARTLTELLLARADGMQQRFYSMSRQICEHRKHYYDVLERTQRSLDITQWLSWFIETLDAALRQSEEKLQRLVLKTQFWHNHRHVAMNDRQTAMVNRLRDGIEGKLTAKKWGEMMKCSAATALRDINDLIEKGILVADTPGGRSTNYLFVTDTVRNNNRNNYENVAHVAGVHSSRSQSKMLSSATNR